MWNSLSHFYIDKYVIYICNIYKEYFDKNCFQVPLICFYSCYLFVIGTLDLYFNNFCLQGTIFVQSDKCWVIKYLYGTNVKRFLDCFHKHKCIIYLINWISVFLSCRQELMKKEFGMDGATNCKTGFISCLLNEWV